MNRPADSMNNKDIAPWGLIMIGVLVVGIWFFAHTQISMVVLWVRWAEAHLLFFDPDGKRAMVVWLGGTTAEATTISGIVQSGNVAGYSLRWFSLAILIAIFAWLVVKSPGRGSRYSKRHTMRSLAVQEAETWPAIRPVLNLNLPYVSLDDPLNGMRMTPRAYARRHGLLLPRWTTQEGLRDYPKLKQLDDKAYLILDKTRKVLEAQLGRKWEGVERLQPYERALFAVFAAQIGHDRDMALAVLNACATAADAAFSKKAPQLLEPEIVTAALAKYGKQEIVTKILLRHAYVRTVLMHMLEVASKNGVLNPALFRWLKMADRVTWYSLEDLGIATSSVESCGVRSHYLAERLANAPLVERLVDGALDGFIDELNRFLDDEEVEDDI
ncbi:MAG: hypothetical protein WKF61_00500 [Luteimonas sp.]